MTNLRQALQSVDLTERELAPLMLGAHPGAGFAALGILLRRVADVILNDRRLLKSWLSKAPELTA
ncbi:MAG TPA: hypothetical protein VFQ04_17355 [Actinomycetes bacterium]|nr:hypothetical protein [Actinomycetes bacterium]